MCETFLRACEKSQNPSPKILEFGIFKNHKNRTFRIFRFSHFFMFGSLFSKMFALAHFHTRVHIFSFPRLLSVQISADSPNSRVKKPQIQVIPHDDTYLSPACHVTRDRRANRRARKYGVRKLGCGVREIRGFRKTEVNQGPVSRVRKTPNHTIFKNDKPLLLSSSIFRFFILPKCAL